MPFLLRKDSIMGHAATPRKKHLGEKAIVLLAGVVTAIAWAQDPSQVVAQVGASASSQPATMATSPPQAEITNYWQLIQDLTARIESAPPRQPSIGRGLDTPTMEYPFDALRNLRATHLVRAAQEGAAAARSQCAGRSRAECDQLARAYVTRALDYLPLISRDPAEGLELFDLLQKKETDSALRCYLLDALAPDAPRELLLAAWLDRVRNRYEQEYRKALEFVAAASREDPEVQVRALDRCFEWYFRTYQKAWENDSRIRAARASGQPIEMAAMLSPHPPEVDSITLKTLREQGAVVGRYADLVAPHIDPLSQRDPRVKEKVRQQLTFILESVLVPDRDRIRKYLDPAYEPPATKPVNAPGGGFVVIPVSPGAPGIPPMPVPALPTAPGQPTDNTVNAPPIPMDSPFGVPLVEPRSNAENQP